MGLLTENAFVFLCMKCDCKCSEAIPPASKRLLSVAAATPISEDEDHDCDRSHKSRESCIHRCLVVLYQHIKCFMCY